MHETRQSPFRIGMVAGELSGDWLGAGLIRALRKYFPAAAFEGIGGPAMQAEGFQSLYPMELLSVMGLAEVLARYPSLKQCHSRLGHYFLQNPPGLFIGVDAPDFNLSLAQRLRASGVKTVQYVSPSVWAWRARRLNKIAKACDNVLTLFPFETAYYDKHGVPAKYVGHPLADIIPFENDPTIARQTLGLPLKGVYIALLPGSRVNELKRLMQPFLETAHWLYKRRSDLKFLIPAASSSLYEMLRKNLSNSTVNPPPITLLNGESRTVMAASDAVLLASGTAALEAMLLKRPMVAAYRLAPLTYWMARKLVRIPYFSLPNLLAGEKLIPEFLQHEVKPERLGPPLLNWLNKPEQFKRQQRRFHEIHRMLRCQANERAARAIVTMLE